MARRSGEPPPAAASRSHASGMSSNSPRRIALVTGGQAAALHDMLKVLRRFPWLKVFVYAVPVQGAGALRTAAASAPVEDGGEPIPAAVGPAAHAGLIVERSGGRFSVP